MTKKVLLSLFLLLMAAASIIGYNFYKNINKPINKTALSAVPQNAAVIIKEGHFKAIFQKLSSSNIIWNALISETELGKNIGNHFHIVDSLWSGPFHDITQDRSIMASMHLSGANHFDFIYYLPLKNSIDTEVIIKKIQLASKKPTEKRKYDEMDIHSINISDKEKISFIHGNNSLIFSYSSVLIEDVIRQLNQENNLLNDSTFNHMINSSGQSSDGNLFVNNKYFSKIINQYVSTSTKEEIAQLENYNSWTELDIEIKPNSFSLSGFSFLDDKQSYLVTQHKGQKPMEINMLSVVPASTAFIYQYGLSDPKKYFEEKSNLIKTQGLQYRYDKYLDNQMERYGLDMEEQFISYIGHEVALLICGSSKNELEENTFIVVHSNKIDDLNKTLKTLSDSSNNISSSSQEMTFIIERIHSDGLFPNILGNPFPNFENCYYTSIESYVVFGITEKGMKNFITNYQNKKVLERNKEFQKFSSKIALKSNLFIYNKIPNLLDLYKEYSKETLVPIIEEKKDLLNKFEGISIQVSAEKNNLFYNNIYLKYNPIYKKQPGSLWETYLDTLVALTPQFVTNHNNGSQEVIVQDIRNKIYLISATGNTIWSKQLSSPVMGKFHQIDLYRNNKLQFLFSTKSKIYLIDRNGNNVEQFPVKLPHEATNGVVPLDYDGNRKYRFLVGCIDNMVYNFDGVGEMVKGWNYTPANSTANYNIWHFNIAGKDYIVIPLSNGTVKIVERSGADRIALENKLPSNSSQVYLKTANTLSRTYITSRDTSGRIIRLYFNDKKEVIPVDDVPQKALFNIYDINNDRSEDHIFCWDNKLKVVDIKGSELLLEEYGATFQGSTRLYHLSDTKLGIGLISTNKIYIINSAGEIADGFPLDGSTFFDISTSKENKTTNLIVGQRNTIINYILN